MHRPSIHDGYLQRITEELRAVGEIPFHWLSEKLRIPAAQLTYLLNALRAEGRIEAKKHGCQTWYRLL